MSEGRAQDEQPAAGVGRRSIVERVAWAAAVVLVGGLAAWGWLRAEPPRDRARFSFALPHDDVLTTNGVAYSPDGAVIVVTGTRAGVEMLYRRTVDQLEAVPIRGTEGGAYPFFSTDGKWLGFFASNALKKVPAEGGPPATMAPTGTRDGASWGPDATIVFASSKSPDLMRVPASGGTPEVLVPASAFKGATALRWPTWLPDGSAVLFSIFSGGASLGSARVGIHLMKTGESRVLVDGTNPAIAPNGQLSSLAPDRSGLCPSIRKS